MVDAPDLTLGAVTVEVWHKGEWRYETTVSNQAHLEHELRRLSGSRARRRLVQLVDGRQKTWGGQ